MNARGRDFYLVHRGALSEYPNHSTQNIEDVTVLVAPACQYLSNRLEVLNLKMDPLRIASGLVNETKTLTWNELCLVGSYRAKFKIT